MVYWNFLFVSFARLSYGRFQAKNGFITITLQHSLTPPAAVGLLYANLQFTLDNGENENSRNICVTQIRENIFPRKFQLI